MNVLSKLMTALRGGMNEAGEAMIDAQALRILDQEVRDASEELKQSKDSLADMLARQKLAEKKVSEVQGEIDKHEDYAVQALKKDDEALALEVAGKIATLENRKEELELSAKQYKDSCEQLRTAIHQTEQNLNLMKQQIDTVKATENVQRAQEVVAARYSATSQGSTSKLRTAMDSLERIKEKQALKSSQMEAANELAGETHADDLQAKLEAAGIATGKTKAEDVLARIKADKAAS